MPRILWTAAIRDLNISAIQIKSLNDDNNTMTYDPFIQLTNLYNRLNKKSQQDETIKQLAKVYNTLTNDYNQLVTRTPFPSTTALCPELNCRDAAMFWTTQASICLQRAALQIEDDLHMMQRTMQRQPSSQSRNVFGHIMSAHQPKEDHLRKET